MANAESFIRRMRPFVHYLRKMESELTCPACSKLLNLPKLLPCNHIFCSQCITMEENHQSDCPACASTFSSGEMQHSIHIETIVNIFKSMVFAIPQQLRSQIDASGTKVLSKESPASSLSNIEEKLQGSQVSTSCMNMHSEEGHTSGLNNAEEKLKQESVHYRSGGKFSQVQAGPSLSEDANKSKPSDGGASTVLVMSGSKKCGRDAGKEALLTQGEPCSPELFGNIEDSQSNKNRNNKGSDTCTNRSSTEVSLKKETETRINVKTDFVLSACTDPLTTDVQNSGISNDAKSSRLASSTEVDIVRESKRPKCYSQHEVNHNIQSLHSSNQSLTIAAVKCSFCHESEITDFTGQMLHYYISGRPAAAEEENLSNVVHFHWKCLEWAPRAYFDGETAKNLEAELSRASKIKCRECKRNGAALGCYVESCSESYHFPCAFMLPGCHLDYKIFGMLCPSHSSFKFPDEESTEKINPDCALSVQIDHSISPEVVTSTTRQQYEGLWTTEPNVCSQWLLCTSDLSKLDQELVDNFGSLTGAAVMGKWKQNVTHVIVSTDERGACNRSQKVLMAILNGKWVLKVDWVKACMEAKHPVAEEPYEVNLDVFGCSNGPKKGRLRVVEKAPKIFSGLKFYFCKHFEVLYRAFLEELVVAAGGNILEEDDVNSKDSNARLYSEGSCCIVFNIDPPEGCSPEDYDEVARERGDELQALLLKIGSPIIISNVWLLGTIAACNSAAELRKGSIV